MVAILLTALRDPADWKSWLMLPSVKARGRVNNKRLMQNVGELNNTSVPIFSEPAEVWRALGWLDADGEQAASPEVDGR